MKDYVKNTLAKLNNVFIEHQDADLRISNTAIGQCKILECDIKYNQETNTVYIG